MSQIGQESRAFGELSVLLRILMRWLHFSLILNVSLVFRSHLQHQTLPLLQVHREQRRGQVGAEGQRTEKDPTGNRRYTKGFFVIGGFQNSFCLQVQSGP